jgi:hypothetical protein
MHLPTCLVCGENADSGPKVAEKMRPLCRTHWDDWAACGEGLRYLNQPVQGRTQEAAMFARAFMDWLTRAVAERRNAVPA